jgi:rhamnose utilization protein RhaD (predicted bifunctional aldolase and dehydrogenase)
MASAETIQFKHVSYLWDEKAAAALAGDEVGLLIYRSNLLGADLRLTNYGGGNTSCKTIEKHPLTGKQTEVMWVKGSGGDLGTLKRSGLAALYMDRLLSLSMCTAALNTKTRWWRFLTTVFTDLSIKALRY